MAPVFSLSRHPQANDPPSSPSIRKHRRTRSNFLKSFSHHSPAPPLDRRPFPSTTDNPPKRTLLRKLSLDNLFTASLRVNQYPAEKRDESIKGDQLHLPSIRSLRNKFSISLRPEGSTRRHLRRVSESVRWNASLASGVQPSQPSVTAPPMLDFPPDVPLTSSLNIATQSYKGTEAACRPITSITSTKDSISLTTSVTADRSSALELSPSARKRPSLAPLIITSPFLVSSKPCTSAFGTPLQQFVFLARNDDCTSWADTKAVATTPLSSSHSLLETVQHAQGPGWWSSSKPRPTSLAQSTFGVDEVLIDLGSPNGSSRFSTPTRRRAVDEDAEDRRIEKLEHIANVAACSPRRISPQLKRPAISPRWRAASALGRAPDRAAVSERAVSYGEHRSRPVSNSNTRASSPTLDERDRRAASHCSDLKTSSDLFSLRAVRSSETSQTAGQLAYAPLRSPFIESDLVSHRSGETGRSSSPRDALIITPHSRSGSVMSTVSFETMRSRHALERDALLKALMSAKSEIRGLKEDNSGLQALLAEGLVEREELRMSLREVQDELEKLQMDFAKAQSHENEFDQLPSSTYLLDAGDRPRRSSVSSSLFACPPPDMSMLINAKMDIDNVICSTPAIQRRRSYPKRVGFQETAPSLKRPNSNGYETRPRKISTGSSTTNISNILSFADSSMGESESEANVSWVLKLSEDDEAHLDDF